MANNTTYLNLSKLMTKRSIQALNVAFKVGVSHGTLVFTKNVPKLLFYPF